MVTPYSLHKELADILTDVQKRWTQCTEIQTWLREVRESLAQQKALAGSIPVISEQFGYIKVRYAILCVHVCACVRAYGTCACVHIVCPCVYVCACI